MAQYETGKRPYISKLEYPDFIRTPPAKQMWNSITNAYPRLAEFNYQKSKLSVIERALLDYITQSEMKKPYDSTLYYPEMEEAWDGPFGGIDFGPGGPRGDFSWDLQDPSDSGVYVFNADTDSCYCPGETRDIEITGTHPIFGYDVTFNGPDATVSITEGIGTNSVKGTIKVDSGKSGMVTIEMLMIAFPGVPGDSNVNIFECSDCCPADPPLATDSYPETIAQSSSAAISVQGGKAPYSWSVSGTDFTLDDASTNDVNNTLNAGASSCGTATITVTDACGDSVEFEVRSTVGQWDFVNNNCVVPGPSDGDGFTRTVGGKRNTQSYSLAYFCSGSVTCNCATGGIGCLGRGGSGSECVDFECQYIVGAGWSGVFPCCNNDATGTSCRAYNAGTPSYYEWNCPP